ncbi:hypothetical protein [Anaeromicropila herbilytica]|nr:hypothetical protein [Anaeromicropila herbilytica]
MNYKQEKIPSICKRLLLHNCIIKMIVPVILMILSLLWLIRRLIIDYSTFHNIKMSPLMIKVLTYNYFVPLIILFTMSGLAYLLLQQLHHPEKSKLGKSVLAHCQVHDIMEMYRQFDQIDQDIYNNGKFFNGVYVGNEWMIGKCNFINVAAFRKDNIRAIFQIHEINFHMNFYHLYIMDQNDKKIKFNLLLSKELKAIYQYLCGEYPYTKQGGSNEYNEFRFLSKVKRMEFYANYRRIIAEETLNEHARTSSSTYSPIRETANHPPVTIKVDIDELIHK